MRERYALSRDGLRSGNDSSAPLPSALRAAREALERADRHPGPLSAELVAEISARDGVQEEGVVLGSHGPSLAFALLRGMAAESAPAAELVVSEAGFEAYADLARRMPVRCRVVPPASDGGQNLVALAERTEGRSVVFLGSPHDPTGSVLSGDALRRFLGELAPEVTVVLDETEREFVRDPGVTPGAGLSSCHPRLVVVRGLSSMHGLPGLRIAYAVAAPDVAWLIQRQVLPYEVGMPAQLAALASLRAEAEVRARSDAIVAERNRLSDELRLLGFRVPLSQSSRIWLPLGADSMAFALACRSVDVDVRLHRGDGVSLPVGASESGMRLLRAAAYFTATRTANRCRGRVGDELCDKP